MSRAIHILQYTSSRFIRHRSLSFPWFILTGLAVCILHQPLSKSCLKMTLKIPSCIRKQRDVSRAVKLYSRLRSSCRRRNGRKEMSLHKWNTIKSLWLMVRRIPCTHTMSIRSTINVFPSNLIWSHTVTAITADKTIKYNTYQSINY